MGRYMINKIHIKQDQKSIRNWKAIEVTQKGYLKGEFCSMERGVTRKLSAPCQVAESKYRRSIYKKLADEIVTIIEDEFNFTKSLDTVRKRKVEVRDKVLPEFIDYFYRDV